MSVGVILKRGMSNMMSPAQLEHAVSGETTKQVTALVLVALYRLAHEWHEEWEAQVDQENYDRAESDKHQ